MDKANDLIVMNVVERVWHDPVFPDSSKVRIADKRVAELLEVLHELDKSLGALEQLPETELTALVSDAIVACGFVDPMEARYAIAAVLETIGVHEPMTEYS